MRRREFIGGLGGAVASATISIAARGQERERRIGILMNVAEGDPLEQARIGAFTQGLQQLGWIEGRNVRFDIRWGAGDLERNHKHAGAAHFRPMILAVGALTVGPLQQASTTVPIVFASVTDPVDAGFVASMARPSGNATGFTQFEYGFSGKWLELLKQVAPLLARAAVLRDSR